MPNTIKTREVVHNIKTKNNKGNLSHFIKSSVVQSKPNVVGNKKERMSSEAEATESVQGTAIKTVSASTHRIKNYGKEKILKHKERIKQQKQFEAIKTSSSIPSKEVKMTKSSKTNKSHYSKQMRYFSITKHKNKIKEAKEIKNNTTRTTNIITRTFKGSAAVIRKVTSSLSTLLGAGIGLILLLVITLFIGVFGSLSSGSIILPGTETVSAEVLAYSDTIEKYAKQYDMEDYIVIIQAVMMQESGGKGNDPMQSSECPMNEKYPNTPNGITDPEYSIEVGIKYLSSCFKEAKVKDPSDTEHIYLALQGYNYGNGYISWAITNFGGYSKANTKVFANEQCAKLGVSAYGDPDYVDHVMRYVSLGFGDIRSNPNFENMQAWGFNNPYSANALFGQCTWFAWGRFYEIYGYSPGFTGDGYQCADQLVRVHPDRFEISSTPKVGAIYSAIGKNHVGVVIGWDGTNITVQDGNLDGKTNTFQEAKTDWKTSTYSLETLKSIYGGIKFANPK